MMNEAVGIRKRDDRVAGSSKRDIKIALGTSS